MVGKRESSQHLVRRPFVHLSHALLPSANHCERMFSASATESARASFVTSDGTQLGKCSRLDWCAPLRVCSSHTLASCSLRNRVESLTNAGQRRRCTYVILPPISLQTRTLGFSQIASAARKISFPFGWPHQPPGLDHRQSPLRDLEQGPERLGERFRDVQQMRALPSGSQRSFGHLFRLTRNR